MEEVKMCLDEAKESMDSAINRLDSELKKIRAGKARPSMLDGVMVAAYGANSPINQVANISIADARTITVQPWDKSLLQEVEKGILQANIGLTPQNDGEFIRLNLPPLTEERRKELVKQAKSLAEDGKISIRNSRKDANNFIKSLQKDGLSEDQAKGAEASVQQLTDDYAAKIDQRVKAKEEDIMSI